MINSIYKSLPLITFIFLFFTLSSAHLKPEPPPHHPANPSPHHSNPPPNTPNCENPPVTTPNWAKTTTTTHNQAKTTTTTHNQAKTPTTTHNQAKTTTTTHNQAKTPHTTPKQAKTPTTTPVETPTTTPKRAKTPPTTPKQAKTPPTTPKQAKTPPNTPVETPTNTPVETPTTIPVDTPTTTPVDTPTTTPVDTPTTTPVDTPTTTPTENPSNTECNIKGSFSKVFAFGDSYTDTGNAHFLGGLNLTSSYSASSTYKNRLCNGRLVIDFLSEALGIPPIPAYKDPSADFKHGCNFAVAGSTLFSKEMVIQKNVSSLWWKGVPTSFQTQMDWFNKYMETVGCKTNGLDSACKVMMDKSLFWLGQMGAVDYSRIEASPNALQMLRDISVTTTSSMINMLLESGAKNIVVQGLPPVGCFSLDVSLCPLQSLDRMGCSAYANKAIMIHNQILKSKLQSFRLAYPDCKIVYADYWNAYLTMLLNPKKFNFEEPFKACCGCGGGKFNFNKDNLCGNPGASVCKDPSKFMNWDGFHLTEASYKHVADLFLNQGFCTPSFSELIKSKTMHLESQIQI